MNTPAHVAAGLLIWKNESNRWAALAVALGAILPDAPMFVFYGIQKWQGTAEQQIWSVLYFRDDWQLFFDLFNSIPLAFVGVVIGRTCQNRFLTLLASSSLLHVLCDLPVHNDDAHRHFLPFTNWRFFSPVSYWDPNHHGRLFMLAELTFAFAACIHVAMRGQNRGMRATAVTTLALYALGLLLIAVLLLSTDF